MKQNRRRKAHIKFDLRCPECGKRDIVLKGETVPRDSYVEFEFTARGKYVVDPMIDDRGDEQFEWDHLDAECIECGHYDDIEEFVREMAKKEYCKKDNVNAIVDHWTYEIERALDER